MQKIVVLDNIRSAHNVGAIFRTADGAGASKIYLCGYTPSPIDRFGREQPEIKKTSLGATESVEWEAVEEIGGLMEKLRGDGVAIAAVEQHERSVNYKDWQPDGPTAFIFGNEVDGVQKSVLEKSETILEIPMRGMLARNRRPGDVGKESLNVGTTVGIILFHFQ